MMTGVVLVTHGDAGAAMLRAAVQTVGELPQVAAVGVDNAQSSQEVQARLEEAVSGLGCAEVVFLVDLGGSTPFNLCCRRCGQHSAVVSGLNMAMLFKLSTANRDQDARALADELARSGSKSISVQEGDR